MARGGQGTEVIHKRNKGDIRVKQKEKEQEHKNKEEMYNRWVQKKIEEELKMDKSTFKVIPRQEELR